MSKISKEEYEETQQKMVALAGLVRGMPLDAFIEAGERADVVGGLFDPTLWMRGHDKLARVLDLAKALRVFQREVDKQTEAELRQIAEARR